MRVRLWDSPYNGGWIWFARRNLRRFSFGRDGSTFWWAILGFSGSITIQNWPGRRRRREA
jgi:hypothetical protein